MQLISKVMPVYLPEPDQATVLRLGLRKLDPGDWLVVDNDFTQFHDNKLHTRTAHGDKVYAALPGSEPAQQELRQLVLGHLTNDHSSKYEISGSKIAHRDCNLSWSLDDESLWQTSLWVQEDICLMELRDREYCLTAASVCAPSNWPLEQKMGCSLDDIHGPVPGYGQQLSRRVNRLFANLKPDRPLVRFNWSVQELPELFWRKDLRNAVGADKAPEEELAKWLEKGVEKGLEKEATDFFWRVERQTLRRLPRTGAIVFTIRIFIHSFSVMSRAADFPTSLSSLLGQLPVAERNYKGLLALQRPRGKAG
jgi:hypothetical protein